MSSTLFVYQSFVARQLGGMEWAEARAFVEAQGYRTFSRGSDRKWAMRRVDYDKLADDIGIATTKKIQRRGEDAAAIARKAAGLPEPRAKRRPARGSR